MCDNNTKCENKNERVYCNKEEQNENLLANCRESDNVYVRFRRLLIKKKERRIDYPCVCVCICS